MALYWVPQKINCGISGRKNFKYSQSNFVKHINILTRLANKANPFAVISSRRPASRRAEKTPQGLDFIESEAGEDSGGEGNAVDNDTEEGADEEGSRREQATGFIVADESEGAEEESSQSEYRRLDAALREQEAESVMPYFPLAFVVSEQSPLQFNFDLFLLDCLTLPRHIQPRDSGEQSPEQAVTFRDAESAITYCTQRLETGWKPTARAQQDSSRASWARLSHPLIDKWSLFRRDGRRLTKALKSGNPALDENLQRVRLDRWVTLIRHVLVSSISKFFQYQLFNSTSREKKRHEKGK